MLKSWAKIQKAIAWSPETDVNVRDIRAKGAHRLFFFDNKTRLEIPVAEIIKSNGKNDQFQSTSKGFV